MYTVKSPVLKHLNTIYCTQNANVSIYLQEDIYVRILTCTSIFKAYYLTKLIGSRINATSIAQFFLLIYNQRNYFIWKKNKVNY